MYNRIIDLKIATPQIIINFAMFLEENNYFEEAFKVHVCVCVYVREFTKLYDNFVCLCVCLHCAQAYERGVALFKWPHLYDIWNTYLTKFMKRYVS